MQAGTRRRVWVNVVLGVWLLTSPIILGYSEARGLVAWNSFVFGIAVTAAGMRVLSTEVSQEERISLVLGVWVIVSPLILGVGDAVVLWNHILVGLGVLTLSLWSLQREGQAASHHA